MRTTSWKSFCTASTLLAILGTLPACVSTTDYNRLRSQVYTQEQENQKQAERLATLEEELSRTKQEVTQPMQSAQANSWAEINTMRGEMAALKGQVEDLQYAHEARQSSANGTVTVESLHLRVQELEYKTQSMASQLGVTFEDMPKAPATPVTPPPVVSTTPRPEPTPISEPESIGSGQELYQRALEGFYAKKYAQAQVTWAEFVKGFPKDPLVPNAVFWQGECFFQMQDYANAVLTYQKVIEKHASSNKYRPALLKQGISFMKLKKEQAGKLVLEDLIKRFPNSAEAKRAKAYLQGS